MAGRGVIGATVVSIAMAIGGVVAVVPLVQAKLEAFRPPERVLLPALLAERQVVLDAMAEALAEVRGRAAELELLSDLMADEVVHRAGVPAAAIRTSSETSRRTKTQ